MRRDFGGMEDAGPADMDLEAIAGGPRLSVQDDDPDTPEAAELAARDASRDMAEDDEDDGGQEALPGFFGSYMVRHGETGECRHGVCIEAATTFAEAVGLMYMRVSGQYPDEQGWLPPHIIVNPSPFLVVDGAPHPVILPPSEEDSSRGSEQV